MENYNFGASPKKTPQKKKRRRGKPLSEYPRANWSHTLRAGLRASLNGRGEVNPVEVGVLPKAVPVSAPS